MAIPKKIIIGTSRVKQSELKDIITEYLILHNEDDDDTDYNILCLYLIMEHMKGESSFFFPYLELLDSSETVMNWKDSEILKVNDPFINLEFINGVRKQFLPLF
jgi:hypothetical protein